MTRPRNEPPKPRLRLPATLAVSIVGISTTAAITVASCGHEDPGGEGPVLRDAALHEVIDAPALADATVDVGVDVAFDALIDVPPDAPVDAPADAAVADAFVPPDTPMG